MKKILVHSYKGGSGKSLIALNLGNLLAEQKVRVLVVEADFDMPVFKEDLVLGKEDPKYFFNEYLKNDYQDLKPYIYQIRPYLDVIYCTPNYKLEPPFNVQNYFEDANEWYLKKLVQVEKGLKQLDYDFIIFDMQPGLNYESVNFSIISDTIFLIARPDDYSIHSTINMYDQFYAKYNIFENKKLYLILNQIPRPNTDVFLENAQEFEQILTKWKIELMSNINDLDDIFEIHLDMFTIFHLAYKGMILPNNQGVNLELSKIIETLM